MVKIQKIVFICDDLSDLIPGTKLTIQTTISKCFLIADIFFEGANFVIQTQNSVSVRHPCGNPRVPKEWFNPVVNKYIPELANRLAQISADAVLNAARLRIV